MFSATTAAAAGSGAGGVSGELPDGLDSEHHTPVTDAGPMRYLITDESPFLHHLWMTLDDPTHSTLSYCYAQFSLFIISASTISFCLETEFNCSMIDEWHSVTPANCSQWELAWVWLEGIAVVIFTIELLLRAVSAPEYRRFWRDGFNWIDVLAILPFYINLIAAGSGALGALSVFRVVRLVRVFRVFKMGKSSAGIKLMACTVIDSFKVLSVLIFTTLITMVVFSSAVFYFEEGEETGAMASHFLSIPRTFWWCLVTMTTVGYGDAYPLTTAGRVVAVLTMFVGVLIIALPITVIGTSFSNQYEQLAFEAAVEKKCTLPKSRDGEMDLDKLGTFLEDMDMRGNLKIALPQSRDQLQQLLKLYDTRENNKLDRGEWKALIRDCVVDPPSFMHLTVQKINKEVHVLRKQVNAIEDSLNVHIARSEARHAELVALLGGASAIKPQTLPGPPAAEPPNGPRPAALDRLDSVSC